ncbi:MAG: hypothetical protein F6K41_02560 [Symploca sp. SIO3E6]|nr:hypothetical protein [Caldora sp. SIO3E6]
MTQLKLWVGRAIAKPNTRLRDFQIKKRPIVEGAEGAEEAEEAEELRS